MFSEKYQVEKMESRIQQEIRNMETMLEQKESSEEKQDDFIPDVSCNMEVLDSLIQSFQEKGFREKISMNIQLFLPEQMEQWQGEWACILQNLLQNALYSCCCVKREKATVNAKAGGGVPWICLSSRVTSSMLIVKMENSCVAGNRYEQSGGRSRMADALQTGQGMEIVADMINRMGGCFLHGENQEVYVTSIGIPLRGKITEKTKDYENWNEAKRWSDLCKICHDLEENKNILREMLNRGQHENAEKYLELIKQRTQIYINCGS